MTRLGLTLLVLGLALGGTARADDEPPPADAPAPLDPPRGDVAPVRSLTAPLTERIVLEHTRRAPAPGLPSTPLARGLGGLVAAQSQQEGLGPALEPDLPYPRFRLEAYLRVNAGYRAKVNHGREGIASTWDLVGDAHVPEAPTFGYRFIIDARVHERLSLGLHYTRLLVDGPTRHIHHGGIGLQDTFFTGDAQVATTVDLQVAEFFVRFVVKDAGRIRFSIGTGAAWASQRVRLVATDGRTASGRAEAFFLPTVSYWFSVKIVDLVSFFFESMSGVIAPWRFPSLISELRAGLRWHLTDQVELVTAVGSSWGMILDTDDLWGGKHGPEHLWRRHEWSSTGGELGLAITF